MINPNDYLENGSDEEAKTIIRYLQSVILRHLNEIDTLKKDNVELEHEVRNLERECGEFDRALTEATERDNVRYWDGEIDEA